jgi:5-methylthioribose kinase
MKMTEELDIEREQDLVAYLRATQRITEQERVEVKVLAGGVSNRTVWVRRESGESWVLKQALAKLRVKVDWFSDPRRVEREALGLQWLAKLAPAGTITPLVFEDPDNHLLAMQAVPEPHENWKSMLLRGGVETPHVEQFAQILSCIHRKGSEQRDELHQVFDDRSFFESLRLEPYYLYTAEQEPRAAPFLMDLVEQTRATQLTLVHGDYSPKNILVREGKLILLDHEVIHFGEPAFDVGFAMTHLLSKANHLPNHHEKLSDAARLFWQTYRLGIAGVDWAAMVEPRCVRHTLGCLLARVAGRSPLEYLTQEQKQRQQRIVLDLTDRTPETMDQLVLAFTSAL